MISVLKQQWRKENNKGIFRMKIKKIFFILFLQSFFVNAQSEKKNSQQSLLWTRNSNQLEFSPKWKLQAEIDNRVFLDEFKQNSLVVRSQVRSEVYEEMEWGAGFVYSGTKAKTTDVISSFVIPEYRLQQDVTIKQKVGEIGLNHRGMVEQRFFQNTKKEGAKEGVDFRCRLRYRLQGDYYLWEKEKKSLKAILSDEIMVNATNKERLSFFDQNRVYAALFLGVNESLGVELGYLNSFQRESSGTDFYNNDIVRITIFQKFKI